MRKIVMEEESEGLYLEIRAIRAQLSEMQNDLKRFAEHSNREHFESLLRERHNEFADVVVAHLQQDAKKGLERSMVPHCQMHETCKALFSDLLNGNAAHLKELRVSEATLEKSRTSLQTMEKKAPYPNCETCFTEVNGLLDNQLAIMQSLELYENEEPERDLLVTLPVDDVIKNLAEPIANKHRLLILKALAGATQTFSSLSQLTKLRGGNLLFHLSKLTESDLILQRSERGDYMITAKGYGILKGVAAIYAHSNK
jgi:DNA-binding transcriptional ArsR family regulator